MLNIVPQVELRGQLGNKILRDIFRKVGLAVELVFC
jgi:hypothetical protein